MSQMTGTDTAGRRSIAQVVGLLFGLTYLAVGLVGFAVTNGLDFASTEGDKLLGLFELNPLHNVVHLLIGAALVWGSRRRDTARAINATVGATYLLVGIAGLFITGNDDANILAINHADNVLHLASAAVLLGSALMSNDTEVRSDSGVTTSSRTTTGTR
jgi:hypothetical protein